jgi:hypothetical protein
MTDEKAIEAAVRAILKNIEMVTVSGGVVASGYEKAAQAAIAAYLAQREADGFVMVPVEPTPHMKEEALFANDNALLMIADCTDMGNAYRAMIAARPKGGVK